MVTLGYGSSFLYDRGTLCYISGQYVRFVDIYNPNSIEAVFDTRVIYDLLQDSSEAPLSIELLHYSHGILTLCFRQSEGDAIPVTVQNNSLGGTILTRCPWRHPRNLVVRNSHEQLCYASHTGEQQMPNGDIRHEWLVRYIEAPSNSTTRRWSKNIQLKNFFGTDIGQTIAFEIFDGYFYAVSNQSTYEVEEIDWTSYYHCYRFSLTDGNVPKLQHMRIWRRQHREGPINDTWTDILLRKDETTGIVNIVEARREWANGTSRQTRTFYFHPLTFEDETGGELANISASSAGPALNFSESAATGQHALTENLPHYQLSRLVGKDDTPSFEEVRKSNILFLIFDKFLRVRLPNPSISFTSFTPRVCWLELFSPFF